MQVPAPRSYRCTYTPIDRDGWPVPSETGVLPFVQVQAGSAESAQRVAQHLTGCPIGEVTRLDPLPAAIAAFCRAFDDTVTGPLEPAL